MTDKPPVGVRRLTFNFGEEHERKLREVMAALNEENMSRMIRRLIDAAWSKKVGGGGQ